MSNLTNEECTIMNTGIRNRAALTATVVGGLILLSACGGGSGASGGHDMSGMSSSSAPATSSGAAQSGQAAANEADATFATKMIPHHAQAVEMAKLAATRASSAEVKELARDIEGAQQPEIDQMTSWLKAWGKPVPDTSMSGMDHGGMNHGDGMMTAAEMQQLENAKGAEFDRLFLTLMIKHHEGAIAMAKQEEQNGRNPDAVALAKKIAQDQTAEIATIKGLLAK
jgi:uncharacterized protein (DUF305 family)